MGEGEGHGDERRKGDGEGETERKGKGEEEGNELCELGREGTREGC